MAVDDAAGRPLRLRLAADSDMLLEIAVGQVGHRRAACVLRRERKGNRVLPGLDPRDDERGPLARLLGAEHRVAADRYPPWLVRPVRSVRTARLGDEDLAARRIDPDPEAGELAIPEHRVALDAQRRDGAVGERPVLQYRHRLRRLGVLRRQVGADAVAGAGGGGFLRVVHEMGVAGGGADLGVPENPADHRQALAERERQGGVAVSQVMDAHALQPGMHLDAVPVVGEIRQAGAGLLAPDDPGIALDPFDAVEHLQDRGRQRHHARAPLAVPEPELARRAVHVVPAQGEDFGLAAAGQHQEPDRRDRRPPHPAPGFRFPQGRADVPILLGGQEPFPGLLAVVAHRLAGIAAPGHQVPGLGQLEHLRQHRDDMVGHRRGVAEAVMERDDILRVDVLHRHGSECRNDVPVDGGPVELLGLGFAMDLHIGSHAAGREIGDGGIGLGLRRDRVQAALDAVDDGGRFATPHVDRHPGAGPEGHPLEAGGTPGLDDVDLAAVGLDADAEAGEVSVPVDGVPAGGRKGRDAAGGEAEGASLRHGDPQRVRNRSFKV